MKKIIQTIKNSNKKSMTFTALALVLFGGLYAVTEAGSLSFVPGGNSAQVFEVAKGQTFSPSQFGPSVSLNGAGMVTASGFAMIQSSRASTEPMVPYSVTARFTTQKVSNTQYTINGNFSSSFGNIANSMIVYVPSGATMTVRSLYRCTGACGSMTQFGNPDNISSGVDVGDVYPGQNVQTAVIYDVSCGTACNTGGNTGCTPRTCGTLNPVECPCPIDDCPNTNCTPRCPASGCTTGCTTNCMNMNPPIVVTRSPSDLTETTATLSGNVTELNNTPGKVWFEYGKSANGTYCSASDLNIKSSEKTVTTTGIFSYPLPESLTPGTLYCYRAYVRDAKGQIAQGSIMQFKTTGTRTNTGGNEICDPYNPYGGCRIGSNNVTITNNVNNSRTTNTNSNNVINGNNNSIGSSRSSNGTGGYGSSIYNGNDNDTDRRDDGCGPWNVLCQWNGGNTNQHAKILIETLDPVNISENMGTIRGYVREHGNGSTADTWLEWGATPGFYNSNNRTTTGNARRVRYDSYSSKITGLTSGVTYYYRACGVSNDGVKSCGVVKQFSTDRRSEVIDPQGPKPQAFTNGATNVYSSMAVLNGNYRAPGTCSTVKSWFEYGRTTDLGYVTDQQSHKENDLKVSERITGLSPDTKYYYRVVAKNCNGVAKGNILNFITSDKIAEKKTPTYYEPATINVVKKVIVKKSEPTVWHYEKRIVYENQKVAVEKLVKVAGPGPEIIDTGVLVTQTQTIIPGSNTIIFSITDDQDYIISNREYVYKISFQNEGEVAFSDLTVRVDLPTGVDFVRANLGNYDEASHSVVVNIRGLAPRSKGSLVIYVAPNSLARNNETFTAMATLSGAQLNNGQITASDESVYQNETSASAGSIMPKSLTGILVALLVLFLLFLGFRWMYHRPKSSNYYGYNAPPAPYYGAPAQPQGFYQAPPAPQPEAAAPFDYVPFDPNKK